MINISKPMRTILLLSLSISILVIGCNKKIDKNDITIINGIQLGTTVDEIYRAFDSLKVPKKTFYTKTVFTDIYQIDKHKTTYYATDIFNISQYRSQYTAHYGIFYPEIIPGTENVIGLNVLLAHSAPALLISKNGMSYITNETQISGISQDISYDLAADISNMLVKKYGTPKDTITFEYTNFFVLDGNDIRNYHSDSANMGDMISWETKYLRISYFKGIRSYDNTYDMNERFYKTHLIKSDPSAVLNYELGERPCLSYGYIKYRLTEEAIKKLELDKSQL